MGPSENPTSRAEKQEVRRRKRPARRPRRRRCLLKGCEQRFRPQRMRQRYCSPSCREGARQWSRWKAQHRYRATPEGQQKRNGQSAGATGSASGTGNRPRKRQLRRWRGSSLNGPPKFFFDHSCDRPGCYEGFVCPRRSPRQRFCSHACRRALERVWERERRWQQRRASLNGFRPADPSGHRPPPRGGS